MLCSVSSFLDYLNSSRQAVATAFVPNIRRKYELMAVPSLSLFGKVVSLVGQSHRNSPARSECDDWSKNNAQTGEAIIPN